MKQCGKHLQKHFEIADYVKSSRSVRLVEEANKLTAPSELLGIYRKFGDYPVSRHGAQALWGRETLAGMADGGLAAYGMPVGGRLVGTPRFGIGTPGHGRDYRLGYGLTVAQGGAPCTSISVSTPIAAFGPGNCGERRFGPAHHALVDGGSRLLASWGCRAQLEGIGRAGEGRGLLGNRRHERPDSPGLASGKIFRNPLPSDADRRLKWNGGQQAYLRHFPSPCWP